MSAAHDLAKPAAVPRVAAPASELGPVAAAPAARYRWRLRSTKAWYQGRRGFGPSRRDSSSGTWCPRRRSHWRRASAGCHPRRGRGRRDGAWCRRRRGRRRRSSVSLVARSDGTVSWRSSPGRNSFSRLQPLSLSWGVGLRPALPDGIIRYPASCIKRVNAVRAALTGACRRSSSCEARSRRPEHIQVVKHEAPRDPCRFPCSRTSRRIFRCGARGRQAEDVRVVRYDGAGATCRRRRSRRCRHVQGRHRRRRSLRRVRQCIRRCPRRRPPG